MLMELCISELENVAREPHVLNTAQPVVLRKVLILTLTMPRLPIRYTSLELKHWLSYLICASGEHVNLELATTELPPEHYHDVSHHTLVTLIIWR